MVTVRPFVISRSLGNQANEDFRKTLNAVKDKYKNPPKEGEEANPEAAAAAEREQAAQEAEQARGPSAFENILQKSRAGFSAAVDYVKGAYREMMDADKESLLSKNLDTADSATKADKAAHTDDTPEEVYTGSSALVAVQDGKGAWQQMKERLSEAPFIREVLKRSKSAQRAASQTDLGKTVLNVGKNVQDKISDAREYWETSQNPLVYTLSGVVDTLTSQTEEAMALTAIKKLDPDYNKEEWAEEVRTVLVPKIIKAHLAGDTMVLKPWLTEAVYSKLAADISTRKHDGFVFDSNLLQVDENALIVQYLEEVGPVIVGVYMVQQINCVKNRKGEIVEVSAVMG